MENLWEMIAKARGVELNEEFLMCYNNQKYKYRITERRLEVINNATGYWDVSCLTDEFIRGEVVIEKIPFRPQKGDMYYTISLNNATSCCVWDNTRSDYSNLIAGLVS